MGPLGSARRGGRRCTRRHLRQSPYEGGRGSGLRPPPDRAPLDRSQPAKALQERAPRAGLGSVRFHDLRHTFGTRVAAAGVPLRTLQEWMGHRDFKTTLIYADYQPNDQEAELVRRAFARFPRRPGAGSATDQYQRGRLRRYFQDRPIASCAPLVTAGLDFCRRTADL